MTSLTVNKEVAAPPAEVWATITDLEGAADRISGIIDLTVLEGGDQFGIGTKWQETRKMFGRESTEVMEVTALEPGSSYTVEANSHGAHYLSVMSVEPTDGGSRLTFAFNAEPEGTMAKVIAATVGKLFEGTLRKELVQDLTDIAAAVEAKT